MRQREAVLGSPLELKDKEENVLFIKFDTFSVDDILIHEIFCKWYVYSGSIS